MIFVWEGAVASLPGGHAVKILEDFKRRMGLFDAAVSYWQVHPNALSWMWTILARTEFRIDLCVTSRQPQFAAAVARKSERENWPIRYVFAESAEVLGRRLPQMPDVERVIYALDSQRWAFGPRGIHVPTAGQVV